MSTRYGRILVLIVDLDLTVDECAWAFAVSTIVLQPQDRLHKIDDQDSYNHQHDDESDDFGDKPENGKRQPDRQEKNFEKGFHSPSQRLLGTGLSNGHNPPCDKVRDEERENTGRKRKENSNQPDDGGIDVHQLRDASAHTGDFLFTDRTVQTLHRYLQKSCVQTLSQIDRWKYTKIFYRFPSKFFLSLSRPFPLLQRPMNILVLNCGSSSVKFQIIQTDVDLIENNADRRQAAGVIERIGTQSLITLQAEGQPKVKQATPLRDHRAALDYILRWIIAPDTGIAEIKSLGDIHAVGHRVVHGGEKFTRSVLIDEKVIEEIEDNIELAPLHNPANLKGIIAARELLGTAVPQVAVFDTAFHSTMPETSYLYAIPYQLYRRYRIRRYGFHGTSHRYVAYRYRQVMGINRDQVNIITLHLGNGCSACAIKNGDSVDTSMGLTPLEGLVMGTRSGDIDPSIIEFIHHKEGMSINEIDTMLNKQSGLLGISGLTNDMRELLEEDKEKQDRRARLAIDIFCYRVRKYIGSYLAAYGGSDAIVFTGGIGENSAVIRQRVCSGLEWMGLHLDDTKNASMINGKEGEISTENSRLRAYVIPTNEELLIARDTLRTVKNLPRRW